MGRSTPDARRCLSVVVPCYNERETIGEVVRRVLASPWTAEVIVVDDGSTDGSVDEISSIADGRLRLLRQPRNIGKGAALRRGFVAAHHDYVIVQDADLEYDPADYDALLGPLVDGHADVVYGSRFHTDKPHRVLYYWHSVGNKLLTTLSNMTTNLNLTDMETCYKAFRREVLDSVELEEDRFGFEPEITAKVAAGGWRIYEVGVTYSGRTYDEGKKVGWRDGMHALYCVARYSPLLARRASRADAALPIATFDEADAGLADVLEALDGADNYNAWITSLLSPYLRGAICEVGAGHGALTDRLATHGHVVACDPSPRAAALLRQRHRGDHRITVVEGGFEAAARDRKFDAVVAVNVLEHIEDDVEALRSFRDHLSPGGHVGIFAPALPGLYSKFDRQIGHHRRYRRGGLAATMYRADLEVVECRYVNSLGSLGWWLLATKLGRTPTDGRFVHMYDRVLVPWLRRVESGRSLPAGQSILCIGRRDE